MNQDLTELIKVYSTKTNNEALLLLNGKSKSNLISILLDLLSKYLRSASFSLKHYKK